MTFPINPQEGDIYKNWTWSGQRWVCGVTPPGPEPGGGVYFGPNPPASPQAGQFWLNTNNDVLYVYDGTNWRGAAPSGVTVSDTAPANPAVGDFWWNTISDLLFLWDGVNWMPSGINALTTVAASPPDPARPGMLWHSTTDGLLYVYDGSDWILAHPQSTVSGPAPPSSPSPGDFWWDTSTSQMYIWDGNDWVATPTAPINGPIIGVTDGSDASPGEVGEYVKFASAALTFTAAHQTQSVTMGTLQPGDWDVQFWSSNGGGYNDMSILVNPVPPGFSSNMQVYDASPASLSSHLTSARERALLASASAVQLTLETNKYANGPGAGTATIMFNARRMR